MFVFAANFSTLSLFVFMTYNKRFLLFVAFLSLWVLPSHAQILGLNSIFRPGVKVGAVWIPEGTLADSSTFGMQRLFINTIIPLKTKVDADFKLSELRKADLKLRQSFLTLNAGMRQLSGNLAGDMRVMNAAVGITGVRASLKKGVVFYTVNVGFVQKPEALSDLHPYFMGAVGKLKIKGLRKQNIYGLALAYQWGGIPLPIPLIGWNRPLSKNWSVAILLPASAQVSHKIARRVKSTYAVNLTSFRAGLGQNAASSNILQQPTFQYSQVQINWQLDAKLSSRVAFFSEVGYAPYRNANFRNAVPNQDDAPAKVGFVGIYACGGLSFNLGKSPINAQLFGNDF